MGPDEATNATSGASARSRLGRLLAPGNDARWTVAVAAAVAMAATWPIRPSAAAHGVDNSYLMGLAMAQQRGLHFGDDLIFNFGPLGFLAGGLSYRTTGLLAWAVQIAVQVGIVVVALALARRVLSLPAATVVVIGLVTLIHPDPADVGLGNQIVVLAVLWSVSRAADADRRPWKPWTVAVAAALSVLALLVKVDTGMICLAATGSVVALGSFLVGGLRRLAVNVAVYAGTAAMTLVVGFVAAGGRIGDLATWLEGSYQIVSAFSGALGLTRSGTVALWEHVGVVAVIVAWLVLVARTEGATRPHRIGLGLVVALIGYLAFRQGFVRYDVFHVRQFIAVALFLPLAFAGAWRPRAVAAMTVAAMVIFLPGQHPSAGTVVEPVRGIRATLDTLRAVVSPGRADALIDQRRAGVRDTFPVAQRLLDRIGDDSVSILPIDIEIAYGHPELNWQPLPIFQDYQANNEWLDDRNRDALENDDRPRFLLRDAASRRIDRQFPRFQPPAENLEMICRYDVVATAAPYELLEETPDRCGEPTTTDTVDARLGDAVPVPARDGDDVLVVARFDGIASSLPETLLTTLYRGPDYFVASPSDDSWHRYVPATQGSWHVLAAPDCPEALPEGTGGSFDSITISDVAGAATSDDAYEVEFATIPFDCPT